MSNFKFIADSSATQVNDPNAPTSTNDNEQSENTSSNHRGLSKGAIIGICVGVGVTVYAAATVVAIRAYSRYKNKKQQEALTRHHIFTDSISSPVMQGNSLGFLPISHQHQRAY